MGEEGNGQPRLSEAAADSDEEGWAGEASAFLVAPHAGALELCGCSHLQYQEQAAGLRQGPRPGTEE